MPEPILTELLDWVGYMGVALYLGSYAALQAGIIRGSSYVYALLNLFAAGFVLASLAVSFNLSSALVQTFWIIISIVGLVRLAYINSWIRFSPEEQSLLHTVFPSMPKPMARLMLSRGNWIDADAGTQITTEGHRVRNLCFLAEGEARVLSGGAEIGRLENSLIGEMNVMEQNPASATVETTRDSRLFVLSADTLKRLCIRDPDFRMTLENGMSRATNHKLHTANWQLSKRADPKDV